MKRVIRLTENDLTKIVRRVIKEEFRFKDIRIGDTFLRFGENGQLWKKISDRQAEFIKNVGKKTAKYDKKPGSINIFPPTMDVTTENIEQMEGNRLIENDLTKIVRRVIKEQMEGNRMIIPDIFTGIIDEVGNITTSSEIISLYNELVSPGDFDDIPQLVGYDSNRDMFINEEGMNIESYVIFDEINYALTGMEPGEESDEF